MRKMIQIIILSLMMITIPTFAQTAHQDNVHPGIEAYIQYLHKHHHFNVEKLRSLFKQVQKKERIIQIIESPYEAKPWYIYRKHFLTPDRIAQGVAFWKAHEHQLQSESYQYGVPPAVVVAILGVETYYGKHQGTYRVIDSLTTLAFYYPKRSAFFKKELTQFLLMCREKHMDPLSPTGSYAGAMGWPQFMPSSYRHYAVDFNHNGHVDIWHSADDVIGSIGHYLYKNRWQAGEPVAMPVRYISTHETIQFNLSQRPKHTIHYWKQHGFNLQAKLASSMLANPLALDMNDHTNYWLAFPNFYSIMSYNPRIHYAMAVYQLSQAIDQAFHHHDQ